jgi:hypothetical protein
MTQPATTRQLAHENPFPETCVDIAYPTQARFVPGECFSRRRSQAGDAAK